MSKLHKIEIPEHLIIDNILPRLPVKTLIQLKSVSKLWLSLISSPQFVKSHLECSSSSSSPVQFLLSIRNKIKYSFKLMSLAYDEQNNLENTIDLGLPQCFEPDFHGVNIVGSSNGLVCFHISLSLYLYNPATHENRKIINPGGLNGLLLSKWFGYVPCLDDYCIVAQLYGYNRHRMYCLRIGKWQIINGDIGLYDYLYHSTTIFDDVFYVSPLSLDTSKLERPDRILGIDLVNVKVKEFPWLDWLNKYVDAKFFVLNGCLSLLCRYNYYSSRRQIRDVWTLNTQGDWRCWKKSFSVHLGDREYIHTVTPTGKFLLGCQSSHNEQFKVTGLNKDTQPLSLFQGDVYFSMEKIMAAKGIGYVESLVSPFGTIKFNNDCI